MNPVPPSFVGFVPLTDPGWDVALRRVPFDFFHLPGYLHASSTHEGGEPLLFLLNLGNHGMLVPLIKRPLAEFGAAYSDCFDATSPYGYPGPLYWGEDWQARMPEMHAHFDAFLRSEKIVSLFLRLNPFSNVPDELLAPLGVVKPHGPTVFLDLRDEALSWKGINSRNRGFITRMLHRGFEVHIDQWDTLDTVIDAYSETMRRLNASPSYYFPRNYFQRLKGNTAPHFHLGTGYSPDGEITGGVFFTEVNGLIHYFLTGTFEKFMDVSPSKLLINALRLWGLERGHHTLHLGGGVGANRDGLFDFKVRFSKHLATFSTFRKILLPDIYYALTQGHGEENPDEEFFPIYRKPTPINAIEPAPQFAPCVLKP